MKAQNVISKTTVFSLLEVNHVAGNKIINSTAGFPKPLNEKKHNHDPVYFNRGEVIAWLIKYKPGFNLWAARLAIAGKLWPIHQPQPEQHA